MATVDVAQNVPKARIANDDEQRFTRQPPWRPPKSGIPQVVPDVCCFEATVGAACCSREELLHMACPIAVDHGGDLRIGVTRACVVADRGMI
ncbi:hypothetical protein, partial [Allomesorhizobium alhagi]|uniref:hypothetical protein n=1 Tax=Allomesorhizobium alhagi TaxID=475067 RepID=UPI001FCC1E54